MKSTPLAQLHTHADLFGAASSILCLLHCLLTPAIVSFFPGFVHYLPGDALFHRLLAVAVLLLGMVAFIPGFRLHGRKALLVPIAVGVTLIVAVAWAGEGLPFLAELLCSLTGSMLLIAAHLLNRSFCRQCAACIEGGEACGATTLP